MASGERANARVKILEAADQLFGEVGFDATSTRSIGEVSGVNKALIHYHFKSKDDLFEAVIDGYYARLLPTLRDALAGAGTLEERLGRTLDAYVDFLADNRSFSRMVQREVAGGRHVARIVEHMTPLFEAAGELLGRAYPTTREGSMSAAQLLVSFYGMVITYFSYGPVIEGLLGADPVAPESLALRKEHLRRMLALALAAVAGEGERS